jgi:hypothetical protein
MSAKTSRSLLVAGALVVGLSAQLTAIVGSASAKVQQPAGAIRQPDENGVVGRKVKDYVADQRTGRRLGALDPKLIRLASEPSAYIDDTERVFYADTALADLDASAQPTPPSAAVEPSPTSGGPNDPTPAEGTAPAGGSAFLLNSRPGSPRTIYLDFNGETVTNTGWNTNRPNPKTVPAFDTDGNPSSFSATEEQTIRNVWQAVAEDWAPFEVNVTTQRPASNDAFIRNYSGDPVFGAIAVITPDRWTCSTCGGIAYVDIFDGAPASMYYQYAWVFPSPSWSSTNIANVISHEVGHNFGLGHDGYNTAEYYGGTGNWGPIMGNPSRSYVQWSKGEYALATNAEDDVAIISGYAGVLGDTSNATGNAVQIPDVGLTQTSADDVITSSTDVDFHAVDVTNGYLRVVFNRSLYSNLYPRIALLNSSGAELTATTLFSGSVVTLHSGALANGRYYLKTEPEQDTSSAGFTKYGSLGYFSWSTTRADTPTMTTASLTPLGDRTFTASFAGTSVASEPLTYSVSLCSSTGCAAPVTTTSTSVVLTAPSPTGSFWVSATASNRFAQTSTARLSTSVSVLSKPIAPQVQKIKFLDSSDTIQVDWGGGQEHSPVVVSGHTITVRNRTTLASVSASVSGASGSTPLSIPSTWDAVWVDVSIVSSTSSPAPWNTSDPSAGSLYLGRTSTPSAPGPGAGGRVGAPVAPGATGGRPGAPGA